MIRGPRRGRRTRSRPIADEEFERIAGYGLVVRYAPERAGPPPIWRGLPGAASRSGAPTSSSAGPRSSARTATTSTLAVRDLGARAFASHGETWAAALCLRLGLASAVAAEIGEPPLLLVDDPFSALDPRRRDRIGDAPRGARGPGRDHASPTRPTCPRTRARRLGRARPARVDARGTPDAPREGVRRRASDTRSRDPVPLGDIVDGLLARGGVLARACRWRELASRWPEIVGERLAAETAPVSLEGGVLTVGVAERAVGGAGDVPARGDPPQGRRGARRRPGAPRSGSWCEIRR